jgi:hypothetical protein
MRLDLRRRGTFLAQGEMATDGASILGLFQLRFLRNAQVLGVGAAVLKTTTHR